MRQLWEYALTQMERTLGAIAGVASLSVVLTVPAIWPEYSRQTMLKATKLAGICEDRVSGKTVVQLVPEPEAAAIATICTVVPERPDVQPGDSVVILDLGGRLSCSRLYIHMSFKMRVQLTLTKIIIGGTAVSHGVATSIIPDQLVISFILLRLT